MFCGVSVVDGAEWESLKRYNMNELYKLGTEKEETQKKDEPETKAEETPTAA